MTNTIKCKYCGKEIEITEALQHKIKEEALLAEKTKHQKEIAEVKERTEKEIMSKLQDSFDSQIKNLQKEKQEEKDRNSKLLKQLEDLNDELRKLRRKDEERDLEMKKKLLDEEEKIKIETRKSFTEEHELKDREKDKIIDDLKKSLIEAQKKAQRSSQQLQGEVLELKLEEMLKRYFSEDKIEEIKKGQRGADTKQVVIDKKGRECGTILWESKNAKWSSSWIKKLREDQRTAKAQLGVLVGTDLPDDIETYVYREGVWIANPKMIIALSTALRFDLIHLHNEKLLNVGKNEKMEILFQYLTGTEFQHRIEAIVEAFTNLQQETEREKRWFQTKWARQEKEIRKIIDNTHGMYGDFQAVTGRALGQIKYLEEPEENKNAKK